MRETEREIYSDKEKGRGREEASGRDSLRETASLCDRGEDSLSALQIERKRQRDTSSE